MDPKEVFAKNIDIITKGGRVTCSCNQGLWSVDAPSLGEALDNGFHYFIQYYEDGEYNEKE